MVFFIKSGIGRITRAGLSMNCLSELNEISRRYFLRTTTLFIDNKFPIIHLALDNLITTDNDLLKVISDELSRHSEFLVDNNLTLELKRFYCDIISSKIKSADCESILLLLIDLLYNKYNSSPVFIVDFSRNIYSNKEMHARINNFINCISKHTKLLSTIFYCK